MLPEELRHLSDTAFMNGALAMQVKVVHKLLAHGYEQLAGEVLKIDAGTIRADDDAPRAVRDMSAVSIDELELSVRSSNCLRNNGVLTVGDLVSKTRGELLRMEHYGMGLSLK